MDQSRIRNFCIIAHIDHGKSTLADRLLELTHTVEQRKMKNQMLDQMDLERERGITIKLQPVRMLYRTPRTSLEYQLNLIDTPGHVDFSYEVSRSLAACEGAVLVVDASQGIQAQTLANINLALEHNLTIIPVVNKIDLPNAEPEKTALEMKEAFGFGDDEIIFVSGKTGENVEAILEAVVERVSAPAGSRDSMLRAIIFDSKYDKHRGVVAYLRVIDGSVKTAEKIYMIGTKTEAHAIEVGFFSPDFTKAADLHAGEVGYVVTGLHDVSRARVGDTVTSLPGMSQVEALPGYRQASPMVFASIFPSSGEDYPALRAAMDKFKLNDASLTFEPENIPSLGFGFRAGFLGLLHIEIVQERLRREFGLEIVLTSPSVAYEVHKSDGTIFFIYNPTQLPDPSQIEFVSEPWIRLEIISPAQYIGAVMELLSLRRGIYRSTNYLSTRRVNLHFEAPLSNIISDFYDKLKSVSSGYASMNYEFLDYRRSELVRVDILVAGEKIDALAQIVHADTALAEGRRIVEKLKDLIPKQQFAVALQAAIGGKIIARETIAAMRKDVTAKLYGGDVTRKMKLLKKQKKGKKRMEAVGRGRVEIPKETFLALMKR